MFEALSNIPGLIVTQLPDGIFQVNVPAINKAFKIYNETAFESIVHGDRLVAIIDNDEAPPMLRVFRSADDATTFVEGSELLCEAVNHVGITDMTPIPMFITAIGPSLVIGEHYRRDKHYEIKERADGVFVIKQL